MDLIAIGDAMIDVRVEAGALASGGDVHGRVLVQTGASSAMPAEEVATAVAAAEVRAVRAGIRGKALTPFLLAALAEATGGRSLEANLALLEDDARVAGEIATAATAAAAATA